MYNFIVGLILLRLADFNYFCNIHVTSQFLVAATPKG